MECTCKNASAHQTFEIHVRSTGSGFYERLRFALLASVWCPKPVGVLLWSVLHVLLILGGALLMVTIALICFVFAAALDCVMLLFAFIFNFVELVPTIILAVPILVLWALWLLMKLSWALIRNGPRMQHIREAWRGSVDCFNRMWNDSYPDTNLPDCARQVRRISLLWQCVAYLASHPWWSLLRRWCEEVLLLHDTIAL